MDNYSDDSGDDDARDELFMSIRLDYVSSCSSTNSSSSVCSLEDFEDKEIENPFNYGCRILGVYLYQQMKLGLEEKIQMDELDELDEMDEIKEIMEEIIKEIKEQIIEKVDKNMVTTISKNLPWDEEYNLDDSNNI
jgi:hypothetical protein